MQRFVSEYAVVPIHLNPPFSGSRCSQCSELATHYQYCVFPNRDYKFFCEAHLPEKLLACANYLGIEVERIARVETVLDPGGHSEGLEIVLHISTGRQVGKWVRSNLPSTQIASSS